jgi:hypothetical protein
MSEIADGGLISDFIRKQYRPFDAHEAFERGFSAYQAGRVCNPHKTDSDLAQIWDLGVEAAMRCERASAA